MKTARSLKHTSLKKSTPTLLLRTLVAITATALTLLAVSPISADAPPSPGNQPGADVQAQANPTRTPTPIPLFAETLVPADSATLAPSPTILPSLLIGRVYNDLNTNGIYDDGEGIANVNLVITDANGVSRITNTDLRGGFTLNLPSGPALIAVNESTLPSGVVLQSGVNPSLVTLLSGTPFAFSLGYRTQSDLPVRITPTPFITLTPIIAPSVTPAVSLTAVVTTPVASSAANPPIELALSSRANITASSAVSSLVGVKIGDQIDYTVTVKANSASASELTVNVPIPDGTEYVAGSAMPIDERAEARVPQALRHTVTWRTRPMTSGQTFTARFSVRVVVGTGSIVAKANASNASTGQSISSNEVVNKSKPTAVSLLQFEAIPTSNGIKIAWQTSVELDTFGFALYRSFNGDNRNSAVLLNPDGLIAARGGTGTAYTFTDSSAETGQRYTYWLHEIERTGLINEYGPLQASTETPTAVGIVVPSNVMAGGVPVAPPIGSASQSIPVPATPSINNGTIQMLVTQVVQQQVIIVPTLAPLPQEDRRVDVPQPVPQPAAQTEADATATPEPLAAPVGPAEAPINTQTDPQVIIVDATATPFAQQPDSVANVATIAVPNTPQAQQAAAQIKPLAEAPKTTSNVTRETTRATERVDRQTDWMEWIIWALVIFVVWFVVAGVLGIALGQYLRQR